MQQISSPPANKIGGELTMLSVPLRAEPCGSRDSNPFGAEAPFHEVTVIFTTAASARRARTLKELGVSTRKRLDLENSRLPSFHVHKTQHDWY
jgi:hypothetical protein